MNELNDRSAARLVIATHFVAPQTRRSPGWNSFAAATDVHTRAAAAAAIKTRMTARRLDDADVMRRARDLLAVQEPPGLVENREAAAVERRRQHPAAALLDVVGADRHRVRADFAPVDAVDAQRPAPTACHVREVTGKRDVLRRPVA